MGDGQATKVAWTERTVAELLRKRHAGAGNGGSGEYAFLTQVRDAAGFQAKRTFDAVAISLWPSRGLAIHVFEIKVSRSDWLRELKKPDKAEDAHRVADYFSMVAPAGIVQRAELPPGWGLLEIVERKGGWTLRETVKAEQIDHTDRGQVSRSFLVALLRACPGAVPGGGRTDDEIQAIKAAARAEAEQAAAARIEAEVIRRQGDSGRIAAEWAEVRKAFQDTQHLRYAVRTPSDLLHLVPDLVKVDALASIRRRLSTLAGHLDARAGDVRDVVALLDADPSGEG